MASSASINSAVPANFDSCGVTLASPAPESSIGTVHWGETADSVQSSAVQNLHQEALDMSRVGGWGSGAGRGCWRDYICRLTLGPLRVAETAAPCWWDCLMCNSVFFSDFWTGGC